MRLFALALTLAACTAAPDPVDVLYTGGVVWTGAGPDAEAVGVSGDRIAYVGSSDGAPAASEVVDLDGAFVVPGFIDNHVHFLQGGMQLASVDLRSADSPEEFARRIGEFAAGLPPGRWILGGDWDHEAWGGELPSREWIDAVTPNNPVFVSRLDLHMALANSLALELAGVSSETSDVEGGTIIRAPDGSPTGVLKDEAMNYLWEVIPAPTREERLEALDRAMDHAASLGVTQVHDVGTYGGWVDHETFEAAEDLRVRIYNIVSITSWERLAALIESEGRGDDMLRWGGVKGFVDGSLGSTTAWFYDPYLDDPSTRGLVVTDTTELRALIVNADAAGLQLAIHAIGDRANDWLLDVFAELPSLNGERERRSRIEHAQHLSTDALGRFAEHGVVPSMQPYHAVDDGRWAEKRIGAGRAERTYAFRSLLDAGAPLTFGSDWTVAPLDPLLGIHAAVTRATIDGLKPGGWVPSQKITVEEALRAYTSGNAWAGWQEDEVGTLEPGKLADLVVLDRDLRVVDPEHILGARVLRTVLGGRPVYISDVQ